MFRTAWLWYKNTFFFFCYEKEEVGGNRLYSLIQQEGFKSKQMPFPWIFLKDIIASLTKTLFFSVINL